MQPFPHRDKIQFNSIKKSMVDSYLPLLHVIMPWYEYIIIVPEFYYVSLSFILHCFHLNVYFTKLQFLNFVFKT